MAKQRLDVAMAERGLAESRQKAQAVIMAGQVYVDGRKVEKAGSSTKHMPKTHHNFPKARLYARTSLTSNTLAFAQNPKGSALFEYKA